MPTINPLEDATSSDELQRLIVKYGIRPVSGGSGEGDDDGTDESDSKDSDDSKDAGSTKGDDKSGDDDDGLKAEVEKLRGVRKTLDRDLREKAKRIAELESAGKSETEKLLAERDQLKESTTTYRAKYRDVHAREVVRTEALQLGADPKRVDRIVKMVRPDLAFDDDDDTPTNVKQLLTELKKSDEDLFKPFIGKGDGGTGSTTKPKNQDVNAWLRQAAGRSSG